MMNVKPFSIRADGATEEQVFDFHFTGLGFA